MILFKKYNINHESKANKFLLLTMRIIPAIYIINGKCACLSKEDYVLGKVIYENKISLKQLEELQSNLPE